MNELMKLKYYIVHTCSLRKPIRFLLLKFLMHQKQLCKGFTLYLRKCLAEYGLCDLRVDLTVGAF